MEILGERPVWSMSDSVKLSTLDAVFAEEARLKTIKLQLVADLEQSGYAKEIGAGDTARLMSERYRIDPTEARRDVSLANALVKHPATAAALPDPATPFANPATVDRDDPAASDGWRVHPAQAEAIVSVLAKVPNTVPIENVEFAERKLIDLAATLTPAELRLAGKKIRDILDPDGPEPDEKKAYARESLTLRNADQGVNFRGFLANENAELFRTLIHAHARPHKTLDGEHDPRPRDKRQADALTTLLNTAANTTHPHATTPADAKPTRTAPTAPAATSAPTTPPDDPTRTPSDGPVATTRTSAAGSADGTSTAADGPVATTRTATAGPATSYSPTTVTDDAARTPADGPVATTRTSAAGSVHDARTPTAGPADRTCTTAPVRGPSADPVSATAETGSADVGSWQVPLPGITGPDQVGDRGPSQAGSTGPGSVAGHGPKAHISVTIDFEALKAATATATGELVFGGTLSAAAIRRLACDAEVLPIVLGSKSQPLDVGTSERFVTRAMRRALNARDKGCVVCGAPPIQCEAHHLIHWIDGGITAVSNLVLLCKRHHIDLHAGHWRIQILDGVVHVARPTWATPDPIPHTRYRPPSTVTPPPAASTPPGPPPHAHGDPTTNPPQTTALAAPSVVPWADDTRPPKSPSTPVADQTACNPGVMPARSIDPTHTAAATSPPVDPWGDDSDPTKSSGTPVAAPPCVDPWSDASVPTKSSGSPVAEQVSCNPWGDDSLGLSVAGVRHISTATAATVDPWGDAANINTAAG